MVFQRNCLRNLIAHCGARAFGEPRAEKLMERAIAAFPDLEKYQDGYVSIEHCHLAELKTKVDEFIQATAPHSSVP